MNRKMRILTLFFGVLFFWGLTAVSTRAQTAEVIVLDIDGVVSTSMADYFERGIAHAEATGAEAVIIVMDTPGGLVTVTLDIVSLFRNADVPIIMFIGPSGAQAASAGSVITAASHVAVMAPETVIGAASPISGNGADIPETAYRKAVEDLKATMRGLTESRGDAAVELAEAMIEEARAVTSEEALEAGFIDFVARDIDEIVEVADGLSVTVAGEQLTLDLADARLVEFEMTWFEQFFLLLTSTELLGLLLTIGTVAIIFEVRNPGFGVSGAIGIVCLAVAMFGLNQLPVNWFGLILVAAAFVFFLVEAFTPTSGPLAIMGGLTLLGGILVLFNSPESPEFVRISIGGAVGITALTTGLFAYITAKIIQSLRLQPSTGMEGMIGQTAVSRTHFEDHNGSYAGTILLHGEIWRAIADNVIEKGEDVFVKAIDGFTAKVEKIEK